MTSMADAALCSFGALTRRIAVSVWKCHPHGRRRRIRITPCNSRRRGIDTSPTRKYDAADSASGIMGLCEGPVSGRWVVASSAHPSMPSPARRMATHRASCQSFDRRHAGHYFDVVAAAAVVVVC
jgi:hypothetical protein